MIGLCLKFYGARIIKLIFNSKQEYNRSLLPELAVE